MLKLREEKANRLRQPELKFNWDKMAPTANPTEKIHISEAGETPDNIRKALNGRYESYFLRAIMNEIESLKDLDVWRVSKLPPGRKAIPSKWVFAYKTDPLGSVSYTHLTLPTTSRV